MRVAIIGYGGVGKAFVRLLSEKKEYLKNEAMDIHLNYVIDYYGGIYNPKGIDYDDLVNFTSKEKDITKYMPGGNKEVNYALMLANKDVDIIVEMTPTNKETGEPGMSNITKALENGIHVITSNKGPILLAYKKLNDLAVKNNVQLAIGCTTRSIALNQWWGYRYGREYNILSIEGVLNGTTNFILNEMEQKGVTYNEALLKAQELGIAETNPTLDVEGWDTASKLLILTNVLMNEEKSLKDISVQGITSITPQDIKSAAGEGKKYKLVGRTICENGKISMSVKLDKLDNTHPLYSVDGKNKAVRYTSDTLGDLTVIGGASGVIPAAASILRDMINIHRGYKFSR